MRLIDADALIEAIEADMKHIEDPLSRMFMEANISDIRHMPTIEPERKTGRWIPVTETLPTTDDKVLCCTMTKKGVPGIVIGYYLRGEHGCSWACGMNSNVVAWQPLPEPYEGSKQ